MNKQVSSANNVGNNSLEALEKLLAYYKKKSVSNIECCTGSLCVHFYRT